MRKTCCLQRDEGRFTHVNGSRNRKAPPLIRRVKLDGAWAVRMQCDRRSFLRFKLLQSVVFFNLLRRKAIANRDGAEKALAAACVKYSLDRARAFGVDPDRTVSEAAPIASSLPESV